MNIQLNAFAVGSLLLFFVCFIIMILLFKKKKKLYFIFGLFYLATAGWGLCAFFIAISNNSDIAFLWWRPAGAFTAFIPVFLLHAICLLHKTRNNLLLIFAYSYGILFSVFSLLKYPLFFKDTQFLFSSFYYVKPQILWYFYSIIWFFLVIIFHLKLLLIYKKSEINLRRSQIIYLFFSFAIGFIGGVANFLPFYKIYIYPYGNFAISIYIIGAAYALLKYRVLDIKVAVTRIILFLTIFISLLSIPFLLGIKLLGLGLWIIPVLVSCFVSIFIPFFYKYLNGFIEKFIFNISKKAQINLQSFAMDTFRISDIEKLLDSIVNQTCTILAPSCGGIYVLNIDKRLYELKYQCEGSNLPFNNKIPADSNLILSIYKFKKPAFLAEIQKDIAKDDASLETVLIPFTKGDELFGFLVLGPRKNKAIYSPDDFKIFEVLASQASLALENAILIKEREELVAQRQHMSKMSVLGSIASGVGHNLNNRFNALLTLINMYNLKYAANTDLAKLSKEELEKRQHELIQLLNQIKDESQRGFDIAAAMSKSAKQPIKPQAFHLEEVVSLAFNLLKCEKEFRKVTLLEDYPKKGPKIWASISHIQDVLFNLGDNAYDALHEKERKIKEGTIKEDNFKPTITIKAQFTKDKVIIEVKDNGIGISEEELSKIGTPFYSTKQTKQSSVGLGVWMSQRHLEMNGGSLKIESAYGKGSAFTIVLPLATI